MSAEPAGSARDMQRGRDRGRDLVAVRRDDVDHVTARKAAAPDEVGQGVRAGLVRNHQIDVGMRPAGAREQPIDEAREMPSRQLEEIDAVHLEQAVAREPLWLGMKIDAGTARGKLTKFITGMIRLELHGPHLTAVGALGHRPQNGRRGPVAEQAGRDGIRRPGQGARRDFRRHDHGAPKAAGRQHGDRDIERGEKTEAGRIDVEGRAATIGDVQPAGNERRRRRDWLLRHRRGEDQEIDIRR